MIKATTLRPGFLVSLKTSLVGNVTYRANVLESEHVTDTGELRAKWETEKTISDPAEHERGIKARSKARSIITAVCSQSTFGLLCPESRQSELSDAISEARRVADAFNASAGITRLNVGVIVGRVASDDADAIRAINDEIRSLIEEMDSGVRKLDVEAVRDAANRARSLGQMLSADAAAKVQAAIDSARSLARKVVKSGEQAAKEIEAETLATLARARTAFLDLDEARDVESVTVDSGRALDLGPVDVEPVDVEPVAPSPAVPVRQLEI